MNKFALRRLRLCPGVVFFLGLTFLFSDRFVCPLQGQPTSVSIASGTLLWIQLPRHAPMRMGQTLKGSLLYPVYVDNRIALPAGTVLAGKVIRLEPDRSRRLHARLRGDFTPFNLPVVQFEQLVLPDRSPERIETTSTRDGLRVIHLSPPAAGKKGSFLSRQVAVAKQQVKDTAALVTAPGRGDRLVQWLYTQLPYHPQRIETATTWTVELAQPLVLPPTASSRANETRAEPTNTNTAGTEWQLHAYLDRTLSSASEKPGATFRATIAEPVFDVDKALVVPQGSVLLGEVTQARRARSFGRKGKLRFKFREFQFPNGFSRPVEATLSSIDANRDASLQVDSEGGVQQKSQNRVIVPLALSLLAGRAFDNDGSRMGQSAVAANGFGIIGRVVGIVVASRNVAAGIGFYQAALTFYDLWLAHGHDVTFDRNTRIEVTTSPGRKELPAPAR